MVFVGFCRLYLVNNGGLFMIDFFLIFVGLAIGLFIVGVCVTFVIQLLFITEV